MNTDDLFRKKPLSGDMKKSSSSEETAPSKAPKDLLGLGIHLVRELGLADSNDTLGRWIAHHLAELMRAVDESTDSRSKAEALTQATDLIIRLWRNRDVLPGEANPLAPYRDALAVLSNFERPNYSQCDHQLPKRRQLSEQISRDAERLKLFVRLLDAIPTEHSSHDIDQAALEDEELSFLERLLKYVTFIGPDGAKPEADSKSEELSPQERLRRLLEQLKSKLEVLRSELESLHLI
jgi:hypothetical protein